MMKRSISLLLFILLCTSAFSQSLPQTGKASYYSDRFQHRKTRSGQRYDKRKLTAAHRTLPLGTFVKVTNLKNNKCVVVKINDRGPMVKDRCIDLSRAAAKQIGMLKSGVVPVKVEAFKGINNLMAEAPITKGTSTGKKKINKSQIALAQKQVTKKSKTRVVAKGNTNLAFAVQAGSFNKKSNAQSVRRNLLAKGYKEVRVETIQQPNGSTFKVMVGKYATHKGADLALATLKPKYADAFVVSK
jgi:rare lipoprotein A